MYEGRGGVVTQHNIKRAVLFFHDLLLRGNYNHLHAKERYLMGRLCYT